ncbi:MAG TPA: TetR/AcrR family transcriptional regulator [Acidimicrobiales bacterium]|jgi:AcrR family transcriptional regulator|nr:TetR/AcrR family transcriptional regulator [Acidimicrobiales bacterium]
MTWAGESFNVAVAEPTELQKRLRSVRPPPAVLVRDRERRLTDRQREILDHLGQMFDGGFAHLTMAEIASRSNCSLRTLYGLAPSRDELVLIVVDRNLWRVGRTAMEAIRPDMDPLDALQAYLEAANGVVDGLTEPFARDLATMPAAQRLGDFHAEYLVAVTRCLLDLAVERGDTAAIDTGAAARVMASLARLLSLPEVMPTLRSTPKQAADSLVEIMLRGMRTGAR